MCDVVLAQARTHTARCIECARQEYQGHFQSSPNHCLGLWVLACARTTPGRYLALIANGTPHRAHRINGESYKLPSQMPRKNPHDVSPEARGFVVEI
jgi:hypothetical protein